jgi:putative hydrolase of the HAD superfamily
MLKHLLLDLDNTLYPESCGLWRVIGERINLFMVERLDIHHSEVDARRDHYLDAFGTTLSALRHYYGIDPDEFLEFVHDLPLAQHLKEEPEISEMLGRIPLRKVIFTNADAAHARRVLAKLAISHHFERIIDIRSMEFANKPDRRAYRKALDLLGAEPQECVFVDDSVANLAPATRLGMITVLVRDCEPISLEEVTCHIRHIIDLEHIKIGDVPLGNLISTTQD